MRIFSLTILGNAVQCTLYSQFLHAIFIQKYSFRNFIFVLTNLLCVQRLSGILYENLFFSIDSSCSTGRKLFMFRSFVQLIFSQSIDRTLGGTAIIIIIIIRG